MFGFFMTSCIVFITWRYQDRILLFMQSWIAIKMLHFEKEKYIWWVVLKLKKYYRVYARKWLWSVDKKFYSFGRILTLFCPGLWSTPSTPSAVIHRNTVFSSPDSIGCIHVTVVVINPESLVLSFNHLCAQSTPYWESTHTWSLTRGYE